MKRLKARAKTRPSTVVLTLLHIEGRYFLELMDDGSTKAYRTLDDAQAAYKANVGANLGYHLTFAPRFVPYQGAAATLKRFVADTRPVAYRNKVGGMVGLLLNDQGIALYNQGVEPTHFKFMSADRPVIRDDAASEKRGK